MESSESKMKEGRKRTKSNPSNTISILNPFKALEESGLRVSR